MPSKLKCPHCGAPVDIPAEVADAAEKWINRRKVGNDRMRRKRAVDPNYGQIKKKQ